MAGPVAFLTRGHRWRWIAAAGAIAASTQTTRRESPAPRCETTTMTADPRATTPVRDVPADAPRPDALPAWATRADRPARRIAGRVVDERGAGVPSLVHLRLDQHAELWRGRDVVTDAHGRFDFGVQPAGVFHLLAEAPGLASRVVDVRTDGGAANGAQDGGDAELVLHACQVVRGVVRVGTRPVIGARVSHGGVTMAHSGAGGRFELCATESWIDVDAPGLAVPRALGLDDQGPVNAIELWPTRRLEGRIVDERGAPRAGVGVIPVNGDSGRLAGYPGAAGATTDANGAFAIDLPDPDVVGAWDAGVARRYMVYLRTSGHSLPYTYLAVGANGTITVSDQDLLEDAVPRFAARVRGRVMRDGRPVGDAWVEADPAPGGLASVTRTRSDGRFELALEADQLGRVDVSGWDDHDRALEARRVRVRAGTVVRIGTLRVVGD